MYHSRLITFLLALGALLVRTETVELQNETYPSNIQNNWVNHDTVTNISSLIQPESRILRGQEVGGPLPYMVLIVQHVVNTFTKVKCTGTYLGDGWVLTAQHCAPLKKGVNEIYLSTYDLTKPIFKAGIKATYKAPKPGVFSSPHISEYDILLIKLDRAVPANVRMETVCLSGWKDVGNVQVNSLGWGRTQCVKNEDLKKGVLRQTMGIGLSAETCRTNFQRNPKTLCAMFNTAGIPDDGDSGGPLFIQNAGGNPLQVGVYSSSYFVAGDKLKCSDPTKPGLYTRVSFYLDWISKKYPKVCIIGGKIKPPVEPGKQSSCFGSKCKKGDQVRKGATAPKRQGSRNPREVYL